MVKVVRMSMGLLLERFGDIQEYLLDTLITEEELEGSTLLYEIIVDEGYRDEVRRLKNGDIAWLDSESDSDILFKREEDKQWFLNVLEQRSRGGE